ncbi:MAG: 2-succinyl-5-enolpyruvyl-6-hydroxy-3-cyclohexene-1-carboxylic-acid synthase [Muribaculaceae bacterium]|nr:2-succinyl-5-enolpyruvyl-6-hydroxy-3-cyclohexene-1-carboxylic-acid synthase [Muribaculaceae bacterium]
MLTTDKYSCRYLVAALERYGVRRVVVSPGSRNAPLILAAARSRKLVCDVVVDERSAAFVALGIAVQTGCPVAMICTSGSAALNYAPALAEAYYRHVPLIAVTADRPEEWIDQDDSQTIRQAGALSAVTKGCFDVPVCRGDKGLERLCRRRICDAIMLATAPAPGPVHLNVQIDEPIGSMADDSADSFTFPERICGATPLPAESIARCARDMDGKKVVVVAGFMPPDGRLSRLLEELPDNVAVLCEAQSNLKGDFVHNIDATLQALSESGSAAGLAPDIVITIGGALLSRMVKTYLRELPVRHWSIGHTDHCIDPLLHLERRIECDATQFFEALDCRPAESSYRQAWLDASRRGRERSAAWLDAAPWSDYKAMGLLLRSVPSDTNLHLSNGTAVRYAQLFAPLTCARADCNRGVSGIDGCTSTAIGAAMAADAPVLLVTGDMSAQYDIGALAMAGIPSSFRMAVLNNGGGGIFRFIAATRSLPETERFLAADVRLPLRELAAGFGFDYYEATDADSLSACLDGFFDAHTRPAILNIITPAGESASTISKYFNRQS